MRINPRDALSALRPRHLFKGGFVFVPLFFAGKASSIPLLIATFTAFVAFGFVAMAVYVINDWHDRAQDALHPDKCRRPFASGRLKGCAAICLVSLTATPGLLLGFSLGNGCLITLLAYLSINLAYSWKLKHIPVVDVTAVASGFNLRMIMGAQAATIPLSSWVELTVFQLALFLALAKRLDDLRIDSKGSTRAAVNGYNFPFLHIALAVLAATTILSYTMYSVSPEVVTRLQCHHLHWSCLFVLIGILRHLQLIIVEGKSACPTHVLLHDRFTQFNILAWLTAFIWILYVH